MLLKSSYSHQGLCRHEVGKIHSDWPFPPSGGYKWIVSPCLCLSVCLSVCLHSFVDYTFPTCLLHKAMCTTRNDMFICTIAENRHSLICEQGAASSRLTSCDAWLCFVHVSHSSANRHSRNSIFKFKKQNNNNKTTWFTRLLIWSRLPVREVRRLQWGHFWDWDCGGALKAFPAGVDSMKKKSFFAHSVSVVVVGCFVGLLLNMLSVSTSRAFAWYFDQLFPHVG